MGWDQPIDLNRPVRTDRSELWIIIPLVLLAGIVAIGLVVPVLVMRYCRNCCNQQICWPIANCCRYCLEPRLVDRQATDAEMLEVQVQKIYEDDFVSPVTLFGRKY